ncbi:hypothetical protein AAFM46_05450 [Arthrobacter sp. TMP15]|uniref:hypothetical protein n=1 Tax=Arthrobacter sp. TMP15 TaxID=3140789 RepID=UPI0031BA7B67
MNNQPRISYHRSIAALSAGAVLALALTGCFPGGGSAKPAENTAASQEQSPAADRGSDDASPTARKSASKESAKAPSDDAPAGKNELTAPGATLKFGEVAYTHGNSGKKDSEDYRVATYETKVTKIVAGSEADLADFKDAAKFAGQTPYYVHADVVLTSLSKPAAGLSDPRITAQLKDGSDAQKLIVFGKMADCETTSFETQGDGDTFSYVVGSHKSMCGVFLAPTGDEITTASYDDSNFSYENYKDNKYRDNPIVWSK